MSLVNEYAARLRDATDETERIELTNLLAGAARRQIICEMRASARRRGGEADAEDGAQDVVIAFVERVVAGKVPPEFGRESGYLQMSARNKVADILKGKGVYKHRRFEELSDEATPPARRPISRSPEDVVELSERGAIARAALAELKPAHRELIEAHDFRGVPLVEIARQRLADGVYRTFAQAKQNLDKQHSRAWMALREAILQKVRARR